MARIGMLPRQTGKLLTQEGDSAVVGFAGEKPCLTRGFERFS